MAAGPLDPDGAAWSHVAQPSATPATPRLAILAWLGTHPHSTAEAVGAGVREQFGTVSTQAVYDMLALSTTAGLLRRIELAEHPARFERRVGDNHHHIVCRRCGRTEDVDFVIGAQPCLAPPEAGGFAVDGAEVVFWGVCPTCQTGGPVDGAQHDQEIWQ